MRKKLIRQAAAVVAAVVMATTVTAGAASAEPTLNPDRASWWASPTAPDLQFRVTKVASTSAFEWDWGYHGGHKDADSWPRPMIVVGEGVPAVARTSPPPSYAANDTVVMKREHVGGNSYRLTVPGAVLETVLEPRTG